MPTRAHQGIVFVVEDDDLSRESTAATFEQAGYLALPARDGEEALSRMRGINFPAVAVVDLRMPGMDGHDLIAAMRDDDELAHIPVVVLSAYARDALVPGANRVFHKPCDAHELVEVVGELSGNL
jgi:CheY-like chemotaxis protein